MNVAELIAHLQTLPQDALVLVDGFDTWGFDYAATPEVVRVVPVKQSSHGPSFVADEAHMLRHHEVTGDASEAVYIGIGDSGT